MIRFRSGHSWKREASATPRDSFSLQVDGIDLLAPATDESLTTLIPELISAVAGLFLRGETLAQVSLPEAHLELTLQRRDQEAEVKVVDLGRPARMLRGPVRVELTELKNAAVVCARSLIRDLGEVSSAPVRHPKVHQMARTLVAIENASLAPEKLDHRQTGYSYWSSAPKHCSFGFELHDEEDLLLYRGDSGSLASLLLRGSIYLQLQRQQVQGWQNSGGLFLLVLELSRQGTELCHAIELQEAQFTFAPGGVAPKIRVDLRHQSVELEGKRYEAKPETLARSIFELGVALSFAISTRSKAQSRNPYLAELVARCREGLSQLRTETAPPAEETTVRIERKKRHTTTRPLHASGRLRRLRYAKIWEKHKLESPGAGRLLWSSSGPLFASSEMACGWAPNGELLFRRVATHGVATCSNGCVLAAYGNQLLGFLDHGRSARWIRNHDGVNLGPEVERREGLLICLAESRAVLALSELTGREIWRMVPSRTRRVFLAIQGRRALLATESGNLFGLDLHDGQIRYRLRVNLPFVGPTVAWGRRFVGLVGRADQHAILSADAHSAGAHWTQEVPVSLPSPPLPHGNRVWVVGERNGGAAVLCFGPKGRLLLDRRIPLGPGPFQLLAVRSSLLISGRNGSAALLTADGDVVWQLGEAGEALAVSIASCLARGVLIVPGERIRVVEPLGGQVLAEVRAGIGLFDLKVDAKLNLYLLDEEGSLSAHRLLSHFALVS